jgi:prolyl-tRNA synthetase
VPIRIEIGPKDVEHGQITIARRDTYEKMAVKDEEALDAVKRLLDDIQRNLFNRAKKFLEEHITTVKSYEEFKRVLQTKGGFIKASWCGSQECERKIKEETGATIRLIPFEREEPVSNCIYCGGEAKELVYFAKSY